MFETHDVIAEVAMPLTIVRTLAAPATDHGRMPAPTTTTMTIRASVQPMGTKELMLLPEGMRNQGAVKVISPVPLVTSPIPDRFDYNGSTWQASKVNDWGDHAGYWSVTAVRVTR